MSANGAYVEVLNNPGFSVLATSKLDSLIRLQAETVGPFVFRVTLAGKYWVADGSGGFKKYTSIKTATVIADPCYTALDHLDNNAEPIDLFD